MNTTALTDSQREQLRSALELRKEQLLQELDAVQRDTLAVASAASRGQADPAGSPRDQANSMAAGMVRDAEAARDHAELTAVANAVLARLGQPSEDGEFVRESERLLVEELARRRGPWHRARS